MALQIAPQRGFIRTLFALVIPRLVVHGFYVQSQSVGPHATESTSGTLLALVAQMHRPYVLLEVAHMSERLRAFAALVTLNLPMHSQHVSVQVGFVRSLVGTLPALIVPQLQVHPVHMRI